MKSGIEETDKSFVFYRVIGKNPVTVTLRCGWIWVEEMEESAPIWRAKRKLLQTYTTEDARNLVAAIQELLPKQESDGKSNDNR